ncbi:transposase, partial [Micromonospora fulviviridis]
WTSSLQPDGTATDTAQVAELTGLNPRVGNWPAGLRLIVRRTRPSARHAKNLTALEKHTGWRYAIVATNIRRIHGVPGSHQPQWLDVLHRSHAGVEDRVRTNKAMGLRNLPSKAWTVNQGWVLAANIAADLAAWTRLLGLHDQPDLADAEPDTLRYRLLHLPAKLATHARRKTLSIPDTWPWAEAFQLCWQRLGLLPLTT